MKLNLRGNMFDYSGLMMKQGYGIRFTGHPDSEYKLIFQAGNNCHSLWRHKKNGAIAIADCSGFHFTLEEHLGPEHCDEGPLHIDFSKKLDIHYYDRGGYYSGWGITCYLIDKNGEERQCGPSGPVVKYLVEEMNMEMAIKVDVSNEDDEEEEETCDEELESA